MWASLTLMVVACSSPAMGVQRARAPGATSVPMAQVQGELSQIRKQDSEHTQKLLFVVKLREALRMRLSAEDEKLAGSNAKVATKISEVMHGQHLQETAAFLQKNARKSDRSAEEISALVATEKKRRSVAGAIEAEQEAMSGDSATLMTDLGKIRSLLLGGVAPQAQPAKAPETGTSTAVEAV